VTVAPLAFAVVLMLSSISSAGPESARPAASAHRAAAAGQLAQERRRVFVGVVGFAALALGLTGLWLVRRSRARPTESLEETAPILTQLGPPSEPVRSSKPGGTMVCPTCRTDYTAEARFCKLDGNRLVSWREGTDPRGPAGGICPVCGQGYDPGISSCPIHQEELIPVALYQPRERASGSFPKICPTCGVQYPNGSGFCGADGSALVTVN
jgi:hypothetical protein